MRIAAATTGEIKARRDISRLVATIRWLNKTRLRRIADDQIVWDDLLADCRQLEASEREGDR